MIDLTPLDVRNKRGDFKKLMRGYDPVVEYSDPQAVLAADHASQGVALALLRNRCVRPGDRFFDIGCGTGVLAVIGARMGAEELVLTDVVPEALLLARNRLPLRLEHRPAPIIDYPKLATGRC